MSEKTVQKNSRISLYDVIDVILEKEFTIWQQFEIIEAKINENNVKIFETSQQTMKYTELENQDQKNIKRGIITIEILSYSHSSLYSQSDHLNLLLSSKNQQQLALVRGLAFLQLQCFLY